MYEQIEPRRFHHGSHAVAAIAIALATILNVAIAAHAQVGAVTSITGAKKHPAVQVAPKKINFDKLHVGMGSPPHGVAFTNKSTVDLPAPSVAVTGTGFSLFFNGCTMTVAAGGNCPVSVVFMPPSKGEFHGSLTFIDGGANSPQKVKLKGIGLAAVPTPTATATATITATPTPSLTPTPTVSATPTPTATGTPTATPTPKPAFNGKVMSGANPVAGSSVAVWAVGSTGYGTGASKIISTISAADGTFNSGIFVCPSPATTPLYLIAQGGNAGGGTNSSLLLMLALGRCDRIGFDVRNFLINEVTTAGSVYALAQFLSTTSPGTVGAPSTNGAGLANAFITETNMVDPASGTALGTPAPQKNLNSIANALAACDQTNGASSAACIELFDCALPGAVFSAGACTGGTGSITDTLSAALSIALNPASVSVTGINDVATKAPLYIPALATAPHDWSMPLSFDPGSNFNRPMGVAIDSSGDVWVANHDGNTVIALKNDGSLLGNFAPAGSNFDGPGSVAIDSSDHVWVSNGAGNTVTALNNNGTLAGNFAPAGSNFNLPSSIAIDGSGHVWVPNDGGTMSALNNNGTLFGDFAPSGANFSTPTNVAIDSSGNVWTANTGNNTVTALNNAGALFGNFAPAGSNFDHPLDLKIDSADHVWVTNEVGNTVTALNNAGTLIGNFAPTGANFNAPQGIAIDSSGRVWIVNSGGNSLTALNNSGTLFGNFVPPGSKFNVPLRIAIDSSGNVWVTSSSANAVTELVGVAAPVKNPFIGPPQLP